MKDVPKGGCQSVSSEQAMGRFFFPFRHFPELRQSVRESKSRGRQSEALQSAPQPPCMEHKVRSFSRARSRVRLSCPAPRPSSPSPRPPPLSAYEGERVCSLQRKMRALQRSSFEEVQGLQVVRKAIMRETWQIRKSLSQVKQISK